MESGKPTDIEMIKQKHEKRKKNKLTVRIIIICLLAVLILLSYFCISVYNDMTKMNLSDDVHITLSGGESIDDISELLKSIGAIKYEFAFKAVAKIKKLDTGFGIGTYNIKPNLKYTYVLRMLKNNLNEKNITVIEGSTLKATIETIAKSGFVSEDELYEAVKDEYDYWFLENNDREDKLEGYLFPETYTFSDSQTAKNMIDKMLSQFDLVFTQEYKKRADEIGMSVDDVIILASLIQGEAASADDMYKVSAVFHKRLEKRDKLQSCASVLYALGKKKAILSSEDIKVDSPYNTYKYSGLPKGPICSPGEEAIRAALYPAECSYYYFQSDAEGKMYFSDTFVQHEKIRKEIQKEQ